MSSLGDVRTNPNGHHRSIGPRALAARSPSTSSRAVATPPSALPVVLITRWNLAMTIFHAALATVTLTVGNVDLAVPVYKTLLDFVVVFSNGSITSDPRAGMGGDRAWKLIPSYGEAGELYITLLVAAFFALSSVFHLLNATLLRDFYLRELRACRTPTRWIEYSLSAPVMIVVIAYGLGVRNRAELAAIAVLVGVTMPFGYWTETAARPSASGADEWAQPLCQRLAPWVVGHVPQSAAWYLIVWQFYDSVADAADRAPWFVVVILWGELALFFSFGMAALLSQVNPPSLFWKGELGFQVLSLASKGLLGILMISNVLILSRFDDIYDTAASK